MGICAKIVFTRTGICVITHIKTTAFKYLGQSLRFIWLIIILMSLHICAGKLSLPQ